MGASSSKNTSSPTDEITKPTDWATLDEHCWNFAQFDLLETDGGWSGNHWLMYLGEGWVVHVTFCANYMSGIVRIQRVNNAIKRETKIRVNNHQKEANTNGYKMRPEAEIWHVIRQEFQNRDPTLWKIREMQRFVRFDLKNANCEHYATKWRYGTGFSLQTEDWDHTLGGRIKSGLADFVYDHKFIAKLVYKEISSSSM
ncbi:phospholipase A and acyltransferase 1-like [Folsomia candida]|uniref:phospholipase A and acyltransferase 1-like n=1 Tax=Folsomia candida TaxID=158441 RepID=UPI001605302D|nr:phospholipase A and acyltransferase 1-like [Folsomia candida]